MGLVRAADPIDAGPALWSLRSKALMIENSSRIDSGNQLLDRLPAHEFEALSPLLQRVSLTLRNVVHESDVLVTHVHFPTTALYSLLTVLEDDDPIEVATVGREGFIGMSTALGVDESPHRVICQLAGEGFRLPTRAFQDALRRGPALSRIIQRFVAFSLRSAGQTVACNSLHTVEARASRWILMVHDQAKRDEFPMTQEFMAYMLGVRRQTVTVVAGGLQNAGLIGVRRGVIAILDRARLEDAACECYAATQASYRRILD